MKKIFTVFITLCILCFTPILIVHAEDSSSEYVRFQEWRSSLHEDDSLIFTMQADMYMKNDDVLRGTTDSKITIQTNGFHIYIDGDSSINNIIIKGNQDVLLQLANNITLSLDEATFINEGDTAIQTGTDSVIYAVGSMDELSHIQANKTGIQTQGTFTIYNCRIIAPQAITNASTLYLNTSDLQGHVNATTIHSDKSYLASYSASSIDRKKISISHNYWEDPDETLYIAVEKGSIINQTILSCLYGNIYLRTDAGEIDFSTPFKEDENGTPTIVYPDLYKRLVEQNPHQFVEDFTPTEISINEFDSFIPTIAILPRDGYYAYVELPSAYGANAIYLDISTDNEHWTSYSNDVAIDMENAHCITTYMFPDELEYKETYYFRIRIEGGIYDTYQSEPLLLTVNNTVLDMSFPFTKHEQIETPPNPILPNQPDEIPELETPDYNPDDIDGNKGQGGGRDESTYQPSTDNDSTKSENTKQPSTSSEKTKQETTHKKVSTQNSKEQKDRNQDDVSTGDTTNILFYLMLGISSCILYAMFYKTHHRNV